MICQWCHHDTKTLDICEWCKRPLKGGKKKAQPTPGEAHLRAKALAKVKKNDRLLIYSMLGVLVLTALVVSYTVVAQPPEADELPAYLDIKKWRDRPQKDVRTTPDANDTKEQETKGEAVQTETPTTVEDSGNVVEPSETTPAEEPAPPMSEDSVEEEVPEGQTPPEEPSGTTGY